MEVAEEEKKKRKVSGGGAFAGMIIGAVLGYYTFGPIGIIIFGVLGAFVGNYAEYDAIRRWFYG